MTTKIEPWFIVITRTDLVFKDLDPIVIGPFENEDEALAHMEDSMDVEDWLTAEAKEADYIVDDCYLDQGVSAPPLGYNAPVMDDDVTVFVPLGLKEEPSP